jgi:transposase
MPGQRGTLVVIPAVALAVEERADQRAGVRGGGLGDDEPVTDGRQAIAAEVQGILDAHPLAKVLTSMPGVGVPTAARILLEVGDGSAFPTAGHLAAYAGLAPVTRRSGTSIRGERPPRGGNKQLKRALFLSAFAALTDPTSRAYYDRKRAAGKRHNAALICLARRRVDVLFAMLRDGTLCQPQPEQAA